MKKTENAHFGQKICTETGPDRSSYKVNADEALMGKKMKGSATDVSHSLGGAGAVQTDNDTGLKPRR